MSLLKRGSIAVVGAAESDLGQVAPNTTPVDLMAQATMRALDDCGLTLKDVDGLFVAASQSTWASNPRCSMARRSADRRSCRTSHTRNWPFKWAPAKSP
jgi:hypothetical protein